MYYFCTTFCRRKHISFGVRLTLSWLGLSFRTEQRVGEKSGAGFGSEVQYSMCTVDEEGRPGVFEEEEDVVCLAARGERNSGVAQLAIRGGWVSGSLGFCSLHHSGVDR